MTETIGTFAGEAAIVTGGASGIGAAVATLLSALGARVLVADINLEAASALAQRLPGLALACDVADEAQVVACFDALAADAGRIDIVVNNAGAMRFGPLVDATPQDWLRMLEVNLLGAAMFTKHALARLPAGGAIVNVTSVHALQTTANVASYAAAKAALLSLTRSTSIEGRARGIRANAVVPGAIDTPMLWGNPNIASGAETVDPSLVGRPEDVAHAVAFLASDAARFVNGTSLVVDGGRLASL